MQRRLNPACVLVSKPSVCFLDEPPSGLDPASHFTMWECLRTIQETTGVVMLLSTNCLPEAHFLCDRVRIMSNGQTKKVIRTKQSEHHAFLFTAFVDHETQAQEVDMFMRSACPAGSSPLCGFCHATTHFIDTSTVDLSHFLTKLQSESLAVDWQVQPADLDSHFEHIDQ